jgi:hypothetical protein
LLAILAGEPVRAPFPALIPDPLQSTGHPARARDVSEPVGMVPVGRRCRGIQRG